MRNTMALVLSGGGGERLGVLTAERAVSAVPFGGKYRIIDFVLSNLCHSGLRRVGILTQHAPTSLHDHVGSGRPWDLDHRTGGVVIFQPYLTRSHAGWYRGTADAIAQNWDGVLEAAPQRVLVLSGDQVYRMDYRALLATHLERRAAVTFAVTRVPPEEAHRFGMVTFDREGRVTALDEKPDRASTPWASMGIYMFDTAVLGAYLSGGPVNLVLDVLRPMLAAGERSAVHVFEGFWEDVGTVAAFYRSNMELLAPQPRLVLDDQSWPILTRDEERPPVRLREGAVIEDALIANGCRVAGCVCRSVLFPGATVEAEAAIADSLIMSDVVVGHGARVDRAILDKYVRLGEGVQVGAARPLPGGPNAWLGGLTLVGKDAVLPPGLRVGAGAIVGVGARGPDFASGEVVPGAIIPDRNWFFEEAQ